MQNRLLKGLSLFCCWDLVTVETMGVSAYYSKSVRNIEFFQFLPKDTGRIFWENVDFLDRG